MQFKIGKPFGPDCDIAQPTRVLINYNVVHVIGLFVGLGFAFCVYLAWHIFFSEVAIFAIYDAGPVMFLGSLAATAVLHEICHLITHPYFWLDNKSFVGIEPKSGLPYAAYIGVMTRARLITILFSPFFILTLLPFCIAYLNLMPELIYLFAWCSLFNTSLSGIDICMIVFVLKYIPKKNLIHGEFHGPTLKINATLQTPKM
jgi:hypothetical protein